MITRIAIQSLLALWLLSLFVLVPVRRGVGGWSDYGYWYLDIRVRVAYVCVFAFIDVYGVKLNLKRLLH